MTIEESIHVIFDESNSMLVEVEVVDCADILERLFLEDKNQD